MMLFRGVSGASLESKCAVLLLSVLAAHVAALAYVLLSSPWPEMENMWKAIKTAAGTNKEEQ